MKCFVIMPFAEEFSPVYDTIRLAVESAVAGEPVSCTRLDDSKAAGRITDRLIRELADAVVCIADITHTNANVMWEVGYAMALDKPMLLISQQREGLPFDLKDMQTVFYEPTDLDASLRQPLGEAFRHTLAIYGVRAKNRRGSLGNDDQFTIAVTGSKQGHEKSIRRELELFIKPHLNQQVRWLVGSWGATDETALRVLLECQQKPIVVGNDEFDVSANMLALIEKHDLSFVAASREPLPRTIQGGRSRDVLFLVRAHLVFLFWSGKSNRVKDLIKFYRDNGKDHAVGFV